MKKNKKIAPTLYSKMRKYKTGNFAHKYQLGMFQKQTANRPFWDETKGRYVKDNPVGGVDMMGTVQDAPVSEDLNMMSTLQSETPEVISEVISEGVPKDIASGMSETVTGDSMSTAFGGDISGGNPYSAIIKKVGGKFVDDEKAHTYTAGEIGADVARLATGDLTAILDMGKKVVERGKARTAIKGKALYEGDQRASLARGAAKEDIYSLRNSNLNLGIPLEEEPTQFAQEGSFANASSALPGGAWTDENNRIWSGTGLTPQDAYGGPARIRKSDNVQIPQDQYQIGKVNEETGESEYMDRDTGILGKLSSEASTQFYGTPRQLGDSGYIMSEMEKYQATQNAVDKVRGYENIEPGDLRGSSRLKMHDVEFNPLGKERPEHVKNQLNRRNMIKAVRGQRQFHNDLYAAQRSGNEDQFLRREARDSRRMAKYGNTRSGVSNFFSNIFNRKQEGGMQLDGGSAVPIPGSDALEFKGNRHSSGGIIDTTSGYKEGGAPSEVEGGETKDGVSSSAHGGKQMPYYFSDYINTDGTKGYKGHSFADEHKNILKEGGSQEDIDGLASQQESLARGPGSASRIGKFQTGEMMKHGGISEYEQFHNLPQEEYDKAVMSYQQSEMYNQMQQYKEGGVKSFHLKGKDPLGRSFQAGGMKDTDYTWYDTGASYFGPENIEYQTDEVNEEGELIIPNMPEVIVTPQMEEARDNPNNITDNITDDGNLINPYGKMDKANLMASFIAPLAAYTMKAGQMPGLGSISDVEAAKYKYSNMNEVRAQNERDYQKIVQFVKTSGGGPADMINMMSAYDKKMEANQDVSSEEAKNRITIDNLNADAQFKARTINVGNELKMKGLKLDSAKTNLLLREDQKANKIEALQTAAENIVTASRDTKAYDASMFLASAIEGDSGVLNRALTNDELKAQVNAYLKGEGNLTPGDSNIKLSQQEIDDIINVPKESDNFYTNTAFVSDTTSFDPNLNVGTRDVKSGAFGDQASVGMYNLQQAISKSPFAEEGFMITSVLRDKDHTLYNKDSLHSSGNAVDFGVKDKDGKAMIKFFFSDWDGSRKTLTPEGKEFLRVNNAELIDETEGESNKHFHLEFNETDDAERNFYPEGHVTGKGFKIYGMQQKKN